MTLHSSLLIAHTAQFLHPRVIFYSERDHPVLHSFPTRRSSDLVRGPAAAGRGHPGLHRRLCLPGVGRSEEHTSELQSRGHLVCRLLLEKKNLKPVIDTRICVKLVLTLA